MEFADFFESANSIPEHPNPYEFGQPVSDDRSFVGRRRELTDLLSAVTQQKGGVAFLRGDYRSGKSSILRRLEVLLERVPPERRRDRFGRGLDCVAISCEEFAGLTECSILRRLGNAIFEETDQLGEDGLAFIHRRLRFAGDRQRHIVFLIDEAGLLPQIADGQRFVAALRFLQANFPVHFVFAGPADFSGMTWGEPSAAISEHVISQLMNVAQLIHVGPLDWPEAVELVRLSERWYGPSRSLRGYEEVVLSLAGTVPYVVQAVCHLLYSILYDERNPDAAETAARSAYLELNPREIVNRNTENASLEGDPYALEDRVFDRLRGDAFDQMSGYFRQIWSDRLDEEERAVLRGIRGAVPTGEYKVTTPVARLERKGYLRRRGKKLWVFSELFELHIQLVSSLEPCAAPCVVVDVPEEEAGYLTTPGIVPNGLLRTVRRARERFSAAVPSQDAILALEDEYKCVLGQVVAYLSQIAIAAYVNHPGLQKPELNTVLRQNRFRSLTHGGRVQYLHAFARLDRMSRNDFLCEYLTSLRGKGRRSEPDAEMSDFVASVLSAPPRGNVASPLDLLDACVTLRNQQSHPETRSVIRTAEERWRVLGQALRACEECLLATDRGTGKFSFVEVVRVGCEVGHAAEVDLRPWDGGREPLSKAYAQDRRNLSSTIIQGSLYPISESGESNATGRLRLIEQPLSPHVVSSGVIAEATGRAGWGPDSAAYMVLKATENTLLYHPVSELDLDGSKRVLIEDSSEGGARLVSSYRAAFERL